VLTVFLVAATTCLGWDCGCCNPSWGGYYDCGYDSCWSSGWGCGYGGWYGGCCGPMWGGCYDNCWSGCGGCCGRKHCLKQLCQRIHQRHACRGMSCCDCGDCFDCCDEPCGFGCGAPCGCCGWGSVAGAYEASCGSCYCGREHCLKHLCQRIRHRHDCCQLPCFLPCACPCDGNFDWDQCCCDDCPTCGPAKPAAAPQGGSPDLGAPPLAPKAPAPKAPASAPAVGGGGQAK
jgi:hypothetical protein